MTGRFSGGPEGHSAEGKSSDYERMRANTFTAASRERAEQAEAERDQMAPLLRLYRATSAQLAADLETAEEERERCREGWREEREATNRAEYKLGQAIDLLRVVKSCESCLDDLPASWFKRADALFLAVEGA